MQDTLKLTLMINSDKVLSQLNIRIFPSILNTLLHVNAENCSALFKNFLHYLRKLAVEFRVRPPNEQL